LNSGGVGGFQGRDVDGINSWRIRTMAKSKGKNDAVSQGKKERRLRFPGPDRYKGLVSWGVRGAKLKKAYGRAEKSERSI